MLPSGKRGLSISWNAFSHMKDVSLRPYKKVVVSLEENVFLNSYANKLFIFINIAPRRTTRHALVDNFSLPTMNGHISGVKFTMTFTIM